MLLLYNLSERASTPTRTFLSNAIKMTSRDKPLKDNEPWADPQIRQNYEQAIGKFLLVYNQIDNLVLEIIRTVLKNLDREDLANGIAKEDLWFRVYILDLLKSTSSNEDLNTFPTEKLKQLSGDRALLAHGHMDQNPFDGSYSLIVKGKDKGRHFSADKINRLAEDAEDIFNTLRYIEAILEFKPLSES